jgi:signal transduction histidine kinase
LKLQLDLLRNNADSSRRERYVAAIAKQVDLMALLIGDMLDLIQIDKMKNQIEFNTLDLNLIVADVASKYKAQLTESAIAFTIEPSEQPLLVIGEQGQLCRAVAHLIRNAINYTHRGKISVRTFRRNGQICLQVTDTGIGIADGDLPFIFQRFYRGTNVSQSTIPGSGLGLSLVQEVAKLHHGALEVESQLDQGSMFRLWFPAREAISTRAVVAW